jgi:enoyl-CoA hydratase/carnithine racemase
VRVIIFTGAGRGFCAGADLSKGGETFAASQREVESTDSPGFLDSGGKVSLALYDCTKPTIAAINGPAVGIGITMTLPMDIRLASDKAKFGFVFARRGIVPEACSSWFLPRVVGISQAADWVLTGRVFGADEAREGGLVSRVLPAEDQLPAAAAHAAEIVQQTSAVSVAQARQMLWKMLGASHPREAHRIESQGVSYMGRSPDAREGVESFLEKRPAKFPMRPSSDMPPFYPWWT